MVTVTSWLEWGYMYSWWSVVVLSSLPQIVNSAILCSLCESRLDSYPRQCELSPPPPQRCGTSEGVQYCSIVKEYFTQGNRISYTRSCTTYSKSGCQVYHNEDPETPSRICYTICNTDGCNGANTLQRNINTVVVTSLILVWCVTNWT